MPAPPAPSPTTAAEGLPRRRFTVAELEQMVKAGIIEEDERIELIGGEVVPMSPKGNHHEVLKVALNLYWARRLPDDLQFATETTFRLCPDTYLELDDALRWSIIHGDGVMLFLPCAYPLPVGEGAAEGGG